MKFCVMLALAIAILAVPFCCTSCAQMGVNDGLVPKMSAQANLPYSPVVTPSGTLLAAPSGQMISPLNETRKAYWGAP